MSRSGYPSIKYPLLTIGQQKSAGLRRFFVRHANDNSAAVILVKPAVLVNDGIVALRFGLAHLHIRATSCAGR